MRYVVNSKANWAISLAGIIANAHDGDTIVVHSSAMMEMAERARRRTCPDKRLTFEVSAAEEEN